jgi:hypothetical protein
LLQDQILSIFTSEGIINYKIKHRNAYSKAGNIGSGDNINTLTAKHFKWEPLEDVVDNPYWMILPSNGRFVIYRFIFE